MVVLPWLFSNPLNASVRTAHRSDTSLDLENLIQKWLRAKFSYKGGSTGSYLTDTSVSFQAFIDVSIK